jgi:hypothetical protein
MRGSRLRLYLAICSLLSSQPRVAQAAADQKSCSTSLVALTKSSLDDAAQPLHAELSTMRRDAETLIAKQSEACGGLENPECTKKVIAEALEPSHTQRLAKFFDDKKEMTCILSKQRSARDSFVANSNMVLNLSASIGTMALFHQSAKHQAEVTQSQVPKFNYALAASMVIFTIYRSIVQCKNELDSNVSGALPNARSDFKQKFLRYTQLNLIGNGLYVGLIAGQDVFEGKNPFEKDNLERYFHEFAVSFAWDTGFSVLNIKLLDKLFLKSLPAVREGLAQKIREGVIRPVFARVGGKPTIVLKVNNLAQIPGFLLDAFIRAAWTAERTIGFMETRETYLDWAIDGTARPK